MQKKIPKLIKNRSSTCSIEALVKLKMYFRCWALDHVAAHCNDVGRTGLCRKCGKENNFAKEFKNKEFCTLCEMEGHLAAGGRCKKFKNAMSQARRIHKIAAREESKMEAGEEMPVIDIE